MKSPESGFTLAALIIFLTAASILTAAAVPAYLTQAQREREEELIFRGQEYVRAILKYQRRFGIFPPSIDALLETDDIRFLRRAYVDPITGDEFRLITVNPDGSISGSTLLGQSGGDTLDFRSQPQMFGEPGGGGAASEDSGGGFTRQSAGTSEGAPQQEQFGGPASGSNSLPQTSPFQSGAAGAAPQSIAGGIVGVAPTNEAASLKLYSGGETYDRWEFIALPGFGYVPGASQTAVPGVGQGDLNPDDQ